MRKGLLILFCLLTLLISGCWDQLDIERRGFVLGLAYDKPLPIPKGQENQADYQQEKKLKTMQMNVPRYKLVSTLQMAVTKKGDQSGGGQSGGGQTTWQITQLGNTFWGMDVALRQRVDVVPYYEHNQVMIFSDSLAKDGIGHFFKSAGEFVTLRRRTKVLISKGEAKSILDVTPLNSDYSALYLVQLASHTPFVSDFGKVIDSLYTGNDFALLAVEATKNEIKTIGLAIFRGDKMVGWADELDTEAIKIINNQFEGGELSAKDPFMKNGIIGMQMAGAKTKIIPASQVPGTIPGTIAELNLIQLAKILDFPGAQPLQFIFVPFWYQVPISLQVSMVESGTKYKTKEYYNGFGYLNNRLNGSLSPCPTTPRIEIVLSNV